MTPTEREKIEKYYPYFHLSKNENGTMWLMYKPDVNGMYRCWEPITDEFWNEFKKLLQARNQAIQDCLIILSKQSGTDWVNRNFLKHELESLKTKP